MTKIDLDAIKARCEALPEVIPYIETMAGTAVFNSAAEEFIIHGRQDVLALIAEVERLQVIIEGITHRLWQLVAQYPPPAGEP